MTAAANSGLRSIDQRRIVKGDVIVTRNVVDTMNKTVNTLSHATSKLANSAAATDIHKLVQPSRRNLSRSPAVLAQV